MSAGFGVRVNCIDRDNSEASVLPKYLESDVYSTSVVVPKVLCTPTKKTLCDHVTKNWTELKQRLNAADDGTSVLFKEFKLQFVYNAKGEIAKNKDGKEIKKLVPVEHRATLKYMVDFIENIMPNVIHHRNMLRLFRNTKKNFMELFPSVYMDVDFSENLTIDILWEIQSLHWCKKQVTVHSGVIKTPDGTKTYHPYISDTRDHDQPFVKLVTKEMLSTTDTDDANVILVESDNCSGQYKSAEHFHDLQMISNDENKTLVRFYGVEGHGKGEVDHVGGIAKVFARDQINRGVIFSGAAHIVSHLIQKFGTNKSPEYHIAEIKVEELEVLRESRCRKQYKTVDGSASFHVMVFKPNQTYFMTSPRLCICEQCKEDYGSCSLFSRYKLDVHELRDIPLRSHVLEPPEIIGSEDVDDFVTPDSYVAIAAPETSQDTVWFVKVIKVNLCSAKEEKDDYQNIIPKGTKYLSGYFLERDVIGAKSVSYKVEKRKKTFVYKESVVFPYVNFLEKEDRVVLSNEDYTDILMHVEHNGLIHV